MIRPAGSIWDTRIQCVCGVVAAGDGVEAELFFCANFGQVSLDPPRLIVNPNKTYPIESLIQRAGAFSVSVLAPRHRRQAVRLIKLRRRQPGKAALAGFALQRGPQGIPYVTGAIRTLFCSVEQVLATGDHTVMIGRVTAQLAGEDAGELPLLYREVSGTAGDTPAVLLRLRRLLVKTGLPDVVRRIRARVRPSAPADLPRQTYRVGGYTDAELERVLSYPMMDRGRLLSPPPPLPALRHPMGVCVVGTHWGQTHCKEVRRANPLAQLFLCGNDRERTARLAGKFGAQGYFVGLESALADPRVHAVVLALPHHLHGKTSRAALEAGKHVLVEKPIATGLREADQMLETARRTGRILMVAENMHFRTSLRLVCERIARGDAGEPLHLLVHTGTARQPENWVADREKLGGGVFMDIGIHYVRAMRLLVGEPEQVSAFRPMQINTRMSGEDGLQVLFQSSIGWRSHFLTTWSATLGQLPDLVLVGDRGTFQLWPLRGYYDFYPVAPRPLLRLLEYVRPYALQQWLMRPSLQRERVRFRGPDDGYAGEMREFLTAVAEQRQPVTPAEDARRDLEIVLRCYESMESGETRVIAPVSPSSPQPGSPPSPPR